MSALRVSDPGDLRSTGDRGLSIVEVILALTLLAVVVAGLAASAGAGLRLTRQSNARQTAVQLATREMELLRASPYGALGLPDTTVFETSATSPDANVDDSFDPPRYTPPLPDGAAEEVVEGGSLTHAEDETIGSRTMRIYRFVTWVSGSDNREKRATIVVQYSGEGLDGTPNRVALSSVFTKGSVDFRQTTIAESILGETIDPYLLGDVFDIRVGDASGFPTTTPFFIWIDNNRFTVTDIDDDDPTLWTVVADEAGPFGHTNGAPVRYVEGGGFSTPSTTTPTTTTPTTTPSSCATNDNNGPTGSFTVIASTGLDGGRWSTSTALKLAVNATDSCQPITVQFRNGTSGGYSGGGTHPSGTSVQYDWSVPGAGAYTIGARYADGAGNVRTFDDEVSVDTGLPEWPSPTLTGQRSAQGQSHRVELTWANTGTDANLYGYRIVRLNGNSGTTDTINVKRGSGGCNTSAATCSYTDSDRTPGTSYTYTMYVVDNAEQLSVVSRSVSCAGVGACNAA